MSHRKTLDVLTLYAPLVEIVTSADLLSGHARRARPVRRSVIPMAYDRTGSCRAATEPLHVEQLALVEYRTAWDAQRAHAAARRDGTGPDVLMLLEHPPVYTAGKRTRPADRPTDGTPSSTSTAAASSRGTVPASSSATPSWRSRPRWTSSSTFAASRRR